MGDVTCSVEGCCEKVHARGWCYLHYLRWYRTGDPESPRHPKSAPYRATVRERIDYLGWDEVVVRPDLGPCHEWKGHRGRRGYGRMYVQGRYLGVSRIVLAEKLGVELTNDLFALHHCDNPPCIRGEHLFAGTAADNSADMSAKGRNRIGEHHPNYKLTDAQVAEIRAAYTGAYGEQSSLARKYGVTSNLIRVIVLGRARKRKTNQEGVTGGRSSLPRGGPRV